MKTYRDIILKSLKRKQLSGGLRTNSEKLDDFWKANASTLEDGMRQAAVRLGTTEDPETLFKNKVASRLPMEKIKIKDEDGKEKTIDVPKSIDSATPQELKKAIDSTVIYDAYRGELGTSNYMKRWFEAYDPVQQGSKPFGGTYSDVMKDFRKETGWRGSLRDWDILKWDYSTNSMIYTSKDGKQWRLIFKQGTKNDATYEEI